MEDHEIEQRSYESIIERINSVIHELTFSADDSNDTPASQIHFPSKNKAK